MSIVEEEMGEPELTYWKPVPKIPQAPPILPTRVSRNPPFHPYPPQFHQQMHQNYHMGHPPMNRQYAQQSGFCYPITDGVHSYIQNQQIGLSTMRYEGERRRVPQYSPVNSESLLTALSSTSQQDSQMMTDSLIHEEVTRAAKTLFSKRNRTLLHWLNPDVSKNQLKIDVNAAWDSLPAAEKVFYISQVLGKFAPHTTSLMVNPQLEPSGKEGVNITIKTEKSDTSADSGCSLDMTKIKRKTSQKKPRERNMQERQTQKIKVEYSSDDNASCDSGLVVDIDNQSGAEVTRAKRKYTKRKQRENLGESTNEGERGSNSCLLPVAISDIKVEPENESTDLGAPKVKRKYIKRKLIRKKYKRREPKRQVPETLPQMTVSPVEEPRPQEDISNDMDIWIELDEAALSKEMEEFKLLSEEVDNFWDNIDDPNSLFLDLEIE